MLWVAALLGENLKKRPYWVIPICFISLFQIRKIQNLMREGGKKHLKKIYIELIFGKVNDCDQIKNIRQISRKVNESDETKQKLFLPIFKKVNEGDKKKAKKNSWQFILFMPEINCFF